MSYVAAATVKFKCTQRPPFFTRFRNTQQIPKQRLDKLAANIQNLKFNVQAAVTHYKYKFVYICI